MESIIQICFYISIFSGGLLIILLVFSIIGGLDLDFDIGDTDVDSVDSDSGGLGIIKSVLAFLAITAWILYITLGKSLNPILSVLASVIAGIFAVLLLSWVLRLLLKSQEEVNWEYYDAIGQTGKVYLKIPENEAGIIQVEINGVTREMKAVSKEQKEIPTGETIYIHAVDEDIAEVSINQ